MFCGNSSGMGDLYAHSELCRQYIYIYIYIILMRNILTNPIETLQEGATLPK